MEAAEYVRVESDRLEDVQALLEGQVFHVTKRAYWPQILASGAISSNENRELPTTFGTYDSYFRNRGCVCLFDYRVPPDDKLRDFRRRCWPFQPATPGSEGIAILVLNPAIYSALVPWDGWKRDEAWREMVVPYVEAGHPGPIPISAIDRVIFLRLTEDPHCLAAVMRRASERAQKT